MKLTITIELDGARIELSEDKAKELKVKLDQLFNEPYTQYPWWKIPEYVPYTPIDKLVWTSGNLSGDERVRNE